MIVVHAMGGVGNQLFQYAVAYSLGKKLKQEVFYDVESYCKDENRRFEIKSFLNIKLVTKKIKESYQYYFWKKLLCFYEKKIYGTKWNCVLVHNILCCLGLVVEYGDFEKRLPIGILKRKKNFMIAGYFQNTEYLNGFDSEVTRIIRSSLLGKSSNRYMDKICVHIRRGDYIGHEYFEVCTEKYYQDAIKAVKNMVPDAEILIFSDDTEYVKTQMNLPYEHVFFEEKSSIETLKAMSQCKYFIISNSTFSWWGQKLCNDLNKIVVAPSKWTQRDDIPCFLYEKDWVILDV